MDLRTRYLGFDLAHPFMPGASPLDDLAMVLRLEDAGASAIVMHSLFEEDVERTPRTRDLYLERLLRIRQRTRLRVIASVNGTTAAGWLRYATALQRGGADAIELNFHHTPIDPREDAWHVEHRLLDIVAVLAESLTVPVAVKLSPYFSALPHLAAELDRLGAAGLVLFNRLYEPDLDVEQREPVRLLHEPDPTDLRLRLRWLAILSGQGRLSLAASGGVRTALDAVKAVLAGADAVQLVSALIAGGPSVLTHVRDGFALWADAHGYASMRDMRGAAGFTRCARPEDYERANYVEALRDANRHTLEGVQ